MFNFVKQEVTARILFLQVYVIMLTENCSPADWEVAQGGWNGATKDGGMVARNWVEYSSVAYIIIGGIIV